MGKISGVFSGIAEFISEVGAELRKSEWPSRQELVGSTFMVIVSVILLGVFIGLSDMVLVKALRVLVTGYR